MKSTGFDRINRLINLKSLNEGKFLSLKEKNINNINFKKIKMCACGLARVDLLPDATFVQFPRNASKCAAAHAAYNFL